MADSTWPQLVRTQAALSRWLYNGQTLLSTATRQPAHESGSPSVCPAPGIRHRQRAPFGDVRPRVLAVGRGRLPPRARGVCRRSPEHSRNATASRRGRRPVRAVWRHIAPPSSHRDSTIRSPYRRLELADSNLRRGIPRPVGLVDGEHVEFGFARHAGDCGAADVEDTEQPTARGRLDWLALVLVPVCSSRVGCESNRLSRVCTVEHQYR